MLFSTKRIASADAVSTIVTTDAGGGMETYWGGKLVGRAIPRTRHEARFSIPDCVEYIALQTEAQGVFDYEFSGLQVVLGCSKVRFRRNNRRSFEQTCPGTSTVFLPDRVWGEWQGEGVALGAYISTGFIERSFERPFGSLNFAHGRHDSPVIEHLVRTIDADVKQGSPAGAIFIQSLVLALLRYLLRSPLPAVKGGLSSRQLKRVKDLIDSELAGGIGVDRLARAVGLSAGHLSRAFKSSTGLSPHQYVLRLRVERAQQLIRDDAVSLGEVAERVGFADSSHMAAVFQRIAGRPPSEFRER
jgi:AraC family transcriptional regulator